MIRIYDIIGGLDFDDGGAVAAGVHVGMVCGFPSISFLHPLVIVIAPTTDVIHSVHDVSMYLPTRGSLSCCPRGSSFLFLLFAPVRLPVWPLPDSRKDMKENQSNSGSSGSGGGVECCHFIQYGRQGMHSRQ